MAGQWLCWCKPVSTGTTRLAAGRLAGDNPEKKERAGCWRLTLAESRSYIHQRPQPRVAHYSLISTRNPSQDIHTSGDRGRMGREMGNGEMKMEEEVTKEARKQRIRGKTGKLNRVAK